MTQAIRIFVGCDPNDCDLEQMMVLEYSLRKHTTAPIELHWMQLSRDPSSPWFSSPADGLGWHTERWVTPFSGFRWAIPALCGFSGRAIYMDSDMVVLRDIAELWNAPFGAGKVLMAKGRRNAWRFCVTVWDCAAARATLPDIEEIRKDPGAHQSLIQYFRQHPELIEPLHTDDNNIDGDGKPLDQIRILHYSDIGTQFSHRYAISRLQAEGAQHWFDGEVLDHPRRDLQALFDRYYSEALAAGYTLDQYRVAQPYGPIVKASQAAYSGNKRTRRKSLWSRIRERVGAVPRRTNLGGRHAE